MPGILHHGYDRNGAPAGGRPAETWSASERARRTLATAALLQAGVTDLGTGTPIGFPVDGRSG